jgi:protein tyrosine/serine phosphatase
MKRKLLSRIKRRALFLALPFILLGLPLGGYVLFTRATGNFHEVVKDEVYRSGQLNESMIAHKVEELGIRSLLNLRGRNRGKDWYDGEVAFCEKLGIQHYDIPLSAGQEVSSKRMAEIVNILKTAPKPLLIHCKDGADRAAFASALYHLVIAGKSPQEADRELTIWYGHVPMLTPHVAAMDRSFWSYARNRDLKDAP